MTNFKLIEQIVDDISVLRHGDADSVVVKFTRANSKEWAACCVYRDTSLETNYPEARDPDPEQALVKLAAIVRKALDAEATAAAKRAQDLRARIPF